MIQSVVKALNILTLLSEEAGDGMSLVELAERIGQKVPTVFNLVGTLESQGYLSRDGATRRYRLGPAARCLGQAGGGMAKLKELARPFVKELGEAIGETVIFTLYRHQERHSILVWESAEMLRVQAHPGVDSHIYRTATGRMLLSQLSQAELEAYWEACGAPGAQWPEVQDYSGLETVLAAIREAGHVSFEPQSGQVRALAVPVRLADGFPAALGVYYPLSRHPGGDDAVCFLRLMVSAADRIAAAWQRENDPI